jgi:hypothetical protein
LSGVAILIIPLSILTEEADTMVHQMIFLNVSKAYDTLKAAIRILTEKSFPFFEHALKSMKLDYQELKYLKNMQEIPYPKYCGKSVLKWSNFQGGWSDCLKICSRWFRLKEEQI